MSGAAIRAARVIVIAVLVVCVCVALVIGAAIVAPDVVEPLWSVPYAPDLAFAFVIYAPMLAGIPIAWGLLRLARRTWQRHALLAWPVGVVVFTAIMDVLPARTWQNNVPLGDKVPGTPDATLLERMGDMLGPAFVGGLVAASFWWLLLGARSSPPPVTGANAPDPC